MKQPEVDKNILTLKEKIIKMKDRQLAEKDKRIEFLMGKVGELENKIQELNMRSEEREKIEEKRKEKEEGLRKRIQELEQKQREVEKQKIGMQAKTRKLSIEKETVRIRITFEASEQNQKKDQTLFADQKQELVHLPNTQKPPPLNPIKYNFSCQPSPQYCAPFFILNPLEPNPTNPSLLSAYFCSSLPIPLSPYYLPHPP